MVGGGYRHSRRATRRHSHRALLRRKRLGFTQRASLKARGLLPRTSKKYRGKYIVSKKYQ